MFKKVLIGIVAVFVILGVIGAIAGEDEEKVNTPVVAEKTETTTEAPKEEAKKEVVEVKEEAKQEVKISREFKAALAKADFYANEMYMSKKGLYEQLTSEYGESFPKDAAKYAVDNVVTDWNKNALEKAKTYQEMNMSRNSVREQLLSKDGEGFTKSEVKYAMDNLPK